MANALQPSTDLKNKTNVYPVGTRSQEATAEDFSEIGDILIDHANKIDALKNADSTNPYYGRYTSLALLQAAHTVGELNAWAVIDAGPGITPQIAIWDDAGQEWEISGSASNMQRFENFAAFPAPGAEDVFYIDLEKNELHFWENSKYNKIGGSSTENTTPLSDKPILTATEDGQTIFYVSDTPDNIDIWFNDAWQKEGATYTYNKSTGKITLINGFSINTGEVLDVRVHMLGIPGEGGGVDSVNNKTGVVVLDTSDIAESTDKNYVSDAEKTAIPTALQPSNLDDYLVNEIGDVNTDVLDLDFDLYNAFQAVLTEDITIKFSNEKPKEITLSVIGDFTLDFENPVIYANGNYDGTVINIIKIKYVSNLEIYVDIQKQVSTYIDTKPRYNPTLPTYNGNILTVGVGGTYSTITDAYTAAIDGDIIKLLNDIDTSLEAGGYLLLNTKKNVKITSDLKSTKIFSITNSGYNIRVRQTGVLTFQNITLTTNQNNTVDVQVSNYIADSEIYFKNCHLISDTATTARPLFYSGSNHTIKIYLEDTILEQMGSGASFSGTVAAYNTFYFSRCLFKNTSNSVTALFLLASTVQGVHYFYNCVFENYVSESILVIGEDTGLPVQSDIHSDIRECKFIFKNNAFGHGVLLGRGSNDITFINNIIYGVPNIGPISLGLVVKTINTELGGVIKGNIINSNRPIYVKGGANLDIQFNYINLNTPTDTALDILNTLEEVSLNCSDIVFKNNTVFGKTTALSFRTETTELISATKTTWDFDNNKYYSNTGIYISELIDYTFAQRTDFWNEDSNSLFIN